MMYQPPVKIRKGMKPLAWLYGIGVNIRHKLFDSNILKSKKYPIPVISVGNITVGGTGKTPHVEMLVRILSPRYKVAVVSRGYKRKSHGLQKVSVTSSVKQVGDEPLQIKQKFPETTVYVDANRQHAIETLLNLPEDEKPDVVLLDDAYQHRYVTPSLSILLVDSKRPIYEDELLPAGNLREPERYKSRASIVIVTKCHPEMRPIDFRVIKKGLQLYPFQSLYFTTYDYEAIQPVFPEQAQEKISLDDLKSKHVVLVAGIANPHPLAAKIEKKVKKLVPVFFPDHHHFTKNDIENIHRAYDALPSDDKIILTTDKDAVRLSENRHIDIALQSKIYRIPITVAFTEKKENQEFKKTILNHVRNYQQDSNVSEREN